MANVRLTHPAINLERTALDLAHYYLHANADEIKALVENVRYQYGKSWVGRMVWGNKAKDVIPSTAMPTIAALFQDNDWGEDAVNTHLMRELIKKLEGYDAAQAEKLTYDEVLLMTPLFIISLEQLTEIAANEEKLKIQNDIYLKQADLEEKLKQLDRYEQKLQRVNAKINKSGEIASLQTKRLTVSLELTMINDSVAILNAEKTEKEAALKKLEADFPKRKINYEQVLRTLIALNPARLSGSQVEQVAKLVQDAMLTFVAEAKKQREKRDDMNAIKEARKQEQALELQRRSAEELREKQAAKTVSEDRKKEARDLCQQVNTEERENVKKKLTMILGKHPAPVLAKTEPVVEVVEKKELPPIKLKPVKNARFQEAYKALSLFHHLQVPMAPGVAKQAEKEPTNNLTV